jgi:hypothetical protein
MDTNITWVQASRSSSIGGGFVHQFAPLPRFPLSVATSLPPLVCRLVRFISLPTWFIINMASVHPSIIRHQISQNLTLKEPS